MNSEKTVIVIGGPTAAGKTAVAIEVALQLDTEIISADSRQCYKELDIGVARPSPPELERVPHHFIASHSIVEEVNAAVFAEYALRKAAEIFKEKDTLVMVGGTGLYIKAFTEGLDAIPDVPPSLREEVRTQYSEKGLGWLQDQVRHTDPAFYAQGEVLNPHRLMRALEVFLATGQSILHFRKGNKAERPFITEKYAIDLPREDLYRNINARVDGMLGQGLVEEVRGLLHWREATALQTVGYREIFEYFDGNCSLEEAAETVRRNTRHYAKRQVTWFKKDPGYQWVPPGTASIIKGRNKGKP